MKAAATRAWQARQNRVSSARFTWSDVRRYSRGSLMHPTLARLHGFGGSSGENGIPTEDTELSVERSLYVAKDKWMRYETQGNTISRDGGLSLQPYVSSYDGVDSRMLWSGGDAGRDPRGRIRAETRNTDAFVSFLRPLVLWYAPLNAEVSGINARSLQVTSTLELVNGAACVHLSDGSTRLWLDPAREYVIVRWLHHPRGSGASLQADVSYTRDKAFGWVPKSWQFVESNGVGGKIEIEATVSSYELSAELTQADFALPFPPRTVVYDHTQKKEYRLDDVGRPVDLDVRSAKQD